MSLLMRGMLVRGGHCTTARPLRWTKRVSYSSQKETDTYLESAKAQLRDYDNWRRHFRWPQNMVRQVLRDYSLWSALALLAYYNLNKRQERDAYDAETFVVIDNLLEKLYERDPDNRLLRGTIWENKRQEVEELRKALEDSSKRDKSNDGSSNGNSGGGKRGKTIVF